MGLFLKLWEQSSGFLTNGASSNVLANQMLTNSSNDMEAMEATHVTLDFEVGQRGHQLVQLPGGGGGRHPGLLLCRCFRLPVPLLLGRHERRGAGRRESRNAIRMKLHSQSSMFRAAVCFSRKTEGATYMGEGTELSSSSRRLSTLGRTSSIPRPATPRLGFSKTGGAVLPEVETPFSWIWWMTEGSGGAVSSVAEKNGILLNVRHFIRIQQLVISWKKKRKSKKEIKERKKKKFSFFHF